MVELVPPYPYIATRLKEGQVIPFLGSGASLAGRVRGTTWEQHTSACLPTAGELADYLASMIQFPLDEPRDLTKVAQYWELVVGRDPLRDELHTIFDRDYPLTALHELLARLPSALLVVTTNYDDLVEQVFKANGKRFDVVVHTTVDDEADSVLWWPYGADAPRMVPPNELDINLEEVTVIYKMHGGVDRKEPKRDNYVITEDDYTDFVARMVSKKAVPAIFAEPFQSRHFLFLGYGLRDWNLRVVLNRIDRDWPRDIVSWAIQHSPSALEQEFWRRRQVRIYDLTIADFVQELEKCI